MVYYCISVVLCWLNFYLFKKRLHMQKCLITCMQELCLKMEICDSGLTTVYSYMNYCLRKLVVGTTR